MTYRRPVNATVTTRTMQALPMTTPRVVRKARSLLAQSPSSATIHVSFRSICVPANDYNKPQRKRPARVRLERILAPIGRLVGAAVCILAVGGTAWEFVENPPLFLLHSLQCVLNGPIMRIGGKRRAIFFRRLGKLGLGLIKLPEPLVRRSVCREFGVVGNLPQIHAK